MVGTYAHDRLSVTRHTTLGISDVLDLGGVCLLSPRCTFKVNICTLLDIVVYCFGINYSSLSFLNVYLFKTRVVKSDRTSNLVM